MSKVELISSRKRQLIIKYILERTKYGYNKIDFGIQRLLAERAYDAAYVLHNVSYLLMIFYFNCLIDFI